MKARLQKSDLERDPNLMWNALIFDVISCEPRTKIQQCAADCFYYDGEVQNGGHFQFFENHGLQHARTVLDSLEVLGLFDSREILAAAYDKAKNQSWQNISSVDEYVEADKGQLFSEEDDAHYSLQPSLLDQIQSYAAEHQAEFFDIVQD